jgi:hypothetical protein
MKTVPGMDWIEVIDRDHVAATVDGEREVFSRSDRLGGRPSLSGLRHFGPVVGDWRMIEMIAADIDMAFRKIGGEADGL